VNVFTIYVNIFGVTQHLMSWVFLVSSFALGMWLTRRFGVIYSAMISILMCQIGNMVYEIGQILLLSTAGRDLASLTLYADALVILCAFAWWLNRKWSFISINRWTAVCTTVLLASLGTMYFTGWFVTVWNWSSMDGADPHNWLWAASKLFGFLVPVSTLWAKNSFPRGT
jgi:hypothetical protein